MDGVFGKPLTFTLAYVDSGLLP